MSEPPHEHGGLLALVVFVFVYAIVLAAFLVPRAHHWVERPALRCSAFVTPPKDCTP